ncbi:hypothetical protein F4821DRAFT_247514 [Hypoxylon rubiginosum]|uniref:Uncharacterized protein n=1 Tax=Hypoxylon rubiginosum TaxID=110542 RepID=A0ACC0CPN9_9PEZI|nr:hypothetical protein F4821DRAFT_247514 [Hypoxylon rubiginosum]
MLAKSSRRKACAACTKAKRPCSKRLPRCERCERKSIPCKYPPINQTAREYAEAADSGSATPEQEPTCAETPVSLPIHIVASEPFYSDDVGEAQLDAGEVYHPCCKGVVRDTKSLPLNPDWFYSPDSWVIVHSNTPAFSQQTFDTAALKQHITTVQSWLRRWANTGRSPFIHHRLYSQKMPRCVQDAYTTLSAYLARTPENSELCLRIIRDRATSLVAESSGTTITPAVGNAMLLDPIEHLARVHALFVYQMIGLFDGDISLRAVAESHMSALTAWVAEMWENAELDASIHMLVLENGFSSGDGNGDVVAAARPTSEHAAWQRWIVSESIRRAWLVVTVTQSIYELFRTGWTQCGGSINWTTRASLWDAPDQYSWSRLVTGGSGPLFVPSLCADLLYEEAAPSDVDEFAQDMLVAHFGLENMAKWKAKSW